MLTLKEISDALSMPFEGDGNLLISGPSEPKNASKNQLALAMTNSFLEDLKRQATINKRQNPWECGGIGRRAGLKIFSEIL